MTIFCVISYYLLLRTVLGRHIYAVGENAKTAKSMGVQVEKVIVFA